MSNSPTLGIDLGTTHSVVSLVENGEPVLIRNQNKHVLTPSVVRFPCPTGDRNHPLVGRQARNTRKQYPNYTVASVKREMGSDTTYEFDGNQYTPPEVASYILHRLKDAAATHLSVPNTRLTDVVITVPAYFSEAQRQATRTAAEMAEFESVELLNEPTAAAIADGYQAGGQVENILVYDLGGGTFDVSVVKVGMNTFRVRATGGDESLGGDDWDRELVEWVASQIEQTHGVNPLEPQPTDQSINRPIRRAQLTQEVRKAKEAVCTRGRPSQIILPHFMRDSGGTIITPELTLDRSTLETVTDHLVEQTIGPVEDAIAESDCTMQEIDDIVLVGGATRMPQVQRRLETLFGRSIHPPSEPDYAVAKGAAIKGSGESVIVQDVTPLALGVGVAHGKFEPVIPRNSPLPTEGTTMLTTSKPNQTAARLEIYQGQADIAEENRYLDTFFISGIAPAAPGIPQIRVEFTVNINGLVTVTAESVDSLSGNIESTLQIEGANNIAQSDIDEHIERVQNQRQKEAKRVTLIEEMSSLEQHISRARQLRKQYAETLTQEHADRLDEAIETGEEYLADDTTTLEQLTQHNEQFDQLLTRVGTDTVSRSQQLADATGPSALGSTDTSQQSANTETEQEPQTDTQPTFDYAEPGEPTASNEQQAQTTQVSPDQSQPTPEASGDASENSVAEAQGPFPGRQTSDPSEDGSVEPPSAADSGTDSGQNPDQTEATTDGDSHAATDESEPADESVQTKVDIKPDTGTHQSTADSSTPTDQPATESADNTLSTDDSEPDEGTSSSEQTDDPVRTQSQSSSQSKDPTGDVPSPSSAANPPTDLNGELGHQVEPTETPASSHDSSTQTATDPDRYPQSSSDDSSTEPTSQSGESTTQAPSSTIDQQESGSSQTSPSLGHSQTTQDSTTGIPQPEHSERDSSDRFPPEKDDSQSSAEDNQDSSTDGESTTQNTFDDMPPVETPMDTTNGTDTETDTDPPS